ncbi:MAG: Uma2 family endonuclease [Pirellulaceae bacterium]|nr:Uma2 family endonuclease [Pirellulaceae bacterium]
MIVKRPPPEQCFLIDDLSWEDYEQFLKVFDDRRFPHTFADGVLEIMTLSQEHEWIKKILARFIENLSIEFKIRMTSSGSTTLKRQLKQRGLEPDESYYIANFSVVRGLKRINLNRHPPPDLVLELDVTNKSLDRLEPYAQLGVPEVWQHDRKGIRFLKRVSDTSYRAMKHSQAFPAVSSDDLRRFLALQEQLDEFDLVNEFIAWARALAQKQR